MVENVIKGVGRKVEDEVGGFLGGCGHALVENVQKIISPFAMVDYSLTFV